MATLRSEIEDLKKQLAKKEKSKKDPSSQLPLGNEYTDVPPIAHMDWEEAIATDRATNQEAGPASPHEEDVVSCKDLA